MERVVARSELRFENGSGDSPSELGVHGKHGKLNEFDFISPKVEQANVLKDVQAHHDDDDQELEFRLFNRTKSDKTGPEPVEAQKIRLRSPSVDRTNAGFIRPGRQPGYYFTKAPSSLEKQQIEAAALSGLQVLEKSKTPWPGSTYSWKVLNLPAASVHKTLRTHQASIFNRILDGEMPHKRTRLGKKSRVRLRMKRAARQNERSNAKAAAETKEAAEREKRTLRNREKKVKKKLRDKAKKVADAADIHGAPKSFQVGTVDTPS